MPVFWLDHRWYDARLCVAYPFKVTMAEIREITLTST